MYESFFGLSDKPFTLTPNPRFVFYTKQYREAEGQLLYGINAREGFMVLTGRPGSGKTTLCRDLIEKLDRGRVQSALLFNPFLGAADMLAALLTDFGITVPGSATRRELLDRLNQFLLAKLAQGRSCVAIFDEAQHLSTEFLEQIRVLSNLETDQEKLLQIVLVGQPELLDRIRAPEMAQLDQRVSIRCTLTDLDEQETERYIHHRLNVAGARGQVHFAKRAVAAIHSASQGVPRLINLVCDRALLAAYAEQTRDITPLHIRKAVTALRGEEAELSRGRPGSSGWGKRAVGFAAAGAVVAASSLIAWRHIETPPVTDDSVYAAASTASPAAAESLYKEIVVQFPYSKHVPSAFRAIAQFQMGRREYARADSSLRLAALAMPVGAERSQTMVEAATVELAAGDTLKACEAVSRLDSVTTADPLLRPQIESVSAQCAAPGRIVPADSGHGARGGRGAVER